jgi:hypothetical protein
MYDVTFDRSANSALHAASETGDILALSALIKAGATDVNNCNT